MEHDRFEEPPVGGEGEGAEGGGGNIPTQVFSSTSTLVMANLDSQYHPAQLPAPPTRTRSTPHEYVKLKHRTAPTVPSTSISSIPDAGSYPPLFTDNLMADELMRSAGQRPEAEAGDMLTQFQDVTATPATSCIQLNTTQTTTSDQALLHALATSNVKHFDVEMYNYQSSTQPLTSVYGSERPSSATDTPMVHYPPNITIHGSSASRRQSIFSSTSDIGSLWPLHAFDDSWNRFCKDSNNNNNQGTGLEFCWY